MAHITVSASLSAEDCPLLARHIREPVIFGKYDINYNKQVQDNKQQTPPESTVPMLAFADSILATNYGYKSASVASLLQEISPTAEVMFAEAISSSSLGSHLYAYVVDSSVPENTGHWKVSQDSNNNLAWEQLLEIEEPYADGTVITVAVLNSRAFIHIGYTITYEFDGTTLVEVELGGLTVTDILGILSSSGYLIAFTTEKPFWSSLSDPLDFVPSDITGAGSTNVQELYGDIVICRAAETGFVLYTSVNAVYAVASTDIRFPFIFREIKGIGGIASAGYVSFGANQHHIVRSGAGLSKVTKQGAQPVMQPINTLITGSLIDGVSAGFDIQESYVNGIDSRFVYTRDSEAIVSYGPADSGSFSHIIHYSDDLNRYSKIKVGHKFAVSNPFAILPTFNTIYFFGDDLYTDYPEEHTYESLSEGVVRSYLDTGIMLVTNTGELLFIEGRTNVQTNGTLILGPFQLIREQTSTLMDVTVSAALLGSVECVVKTTRADGTVVTTAPPHSEQLGKSVRFAMRVTGLSHLVCLVGSFDLSSVILTFQPHSSRR